jgi:hypothetical protein
MPHVLGNAGGPPPPTHNETLLREAVDRLRVELDECRNASRKVADQLAGVVYNHRKACPCTRCEVLHAYDKAMGGK